MKGEFFVKLYDKGNLIEERNFHNLIVNDASLLIARLLAYKLTRIDPNGPTHGIWVLAVGTGNTAWNKLSPPNPLPTQKKLENEIGRKTFTEVNFISPEGLISNQVTNVIDFQTTFLESEAVGQICEFALFGGGGDIDGDVEEKDMGTIVNYKTFSAISKSSSATLTIVLRLTT